MKLRTIWLGLVVVGMVAAQERYDLGGICFPESGGGPFAEIARAEKSGDRDRVIELNKLSVRGMCDNAYRWEHLVRALVAGKREAEATRVVEEMDERGFDLRPIVFGQSGPLGAEDPAMVRFVAGAPFRESAIGRKVARLMAEADVRRARARVGLQALRPGERPPDRYVAKGACPFECCRYGEWTAVADTDLVAAPGSKRVVGRVRKGSRVRVLTGEVHLQPEPVLVVREGSLPVGSIAFILDYEGEGDGAVYSQGKIVSMFHGYDRYCLQGPAACWGETILPERKRRESQWWVKVRLANGVVGWTVEAKKFQGQDGCG